MKTSSQNSTTGLGSRTEQVRSDNTKTPLARIDFKRRMSNRMLGTDQLLALLQQEAPRFFELAEVVGKWVWIHFDGKQPQTVTSLLAELGFHWNNRRQVWQHPCGRFTKGAEADPRNKYGSRFPADATAI